MSLLTEYHALLSAFTSSSSTLSQTLTSLADLFTKLEVGIKENEINALELAAKEEVTKKLYEEVSAREAAVTKREDEAKKKEDELAEREQKFATIMKETELNKEKMMNRVKLNVGGQVFTTSKATLMRIEGCYFEKMIKTGNFHLEDGEYFVDKDARFFDIILNFMRDEVLHASHLQARELAILKADFKFFGIDPDSYPFPFPSHLAQHIKAWLPNKRFKLLYRADKVVNNIQKEFHKHCDKQGNTLILVESTEGHMFGGFSTVEWELLTDDNAIIASLGKDSFIFTLSNPHSIPPTKYSLLPTAVASARNNGCGYISLFVFGRPLGDLWGDIYLRQRGSSQPEIKFSFPQSYADTTGKGNTTFTGNHEAIMKHLLVYQVID